MRLFKVFILSLLSLVIVDSSAGVEQETTGGLGLSRKDVLRYYTKDVSVSLYSEKMIRGTPRAIYSDPSQAIVIELIGDPENLDEASIVTFIGKGSAFEIMKVYTYEVLFLTPFFDGDGGRAADWYNSVMRSAQEKDSVEASRYKYDRCIMYKSSRKLATTAFSVKPGRCQ